MNDWTTFWVRAMEMGYTRDGKAMEQIIGQLGSNPQAALERLVAVKRDTQRAFAS